MDNQEQIHRQIKTEPIVSLDSNRNLIDTFGIVIVCVVILQLVGVLVVNKLETNKIAAQETNIANAKTTLASPKYSSINTQVTDIISGQHVLESSLNSRVNWSKFYGYLNDITPKNVSLGDISLNNDGTFKADGQAATLTDLASTLVAWKSGAGDKISPFSSVKLDNESYALDSTNKTVVTFSISGTVNVGVLNK